MADDTTTSDTITIPELARRLDVSPRTIQRHSDELEKVGATKTGAGWRVPVEAVETLGAMLRGKRQATHDTDSRASAPRQATSDDLVVSLRIENAELKAVVEQQRQRIEFLEAQNTNLVETSKEVANANAAMALSMRETVSRIAGGAQRANAEAVDATSPQQPTPRRRFFSRFI